MLKESVSKSISNKKYVNENLYVVDSKLLESVNGFSKDLNILNSISEKHFYVDRNDAEENNAYKQIVANVLLVYKKGDTLNFGVLQRNNHYTENALNCTIGMVGGHVNDKDISIRDALVREICEEVNIDKDFASKHFKDFGIINNNDTGTISDYHTGYVSVLDLTQYGDIDLLESKETNQKLIWVTIPLSVKNVLKQINDGTYPRFQLMDKWLQIVIFEFIAQYTI